MNLLKVSIFGILFCLTSISCEKAVLNKRVTGKIEKQQGSFHQYGSHLIMEFRGEQINSEYALRSDLIELDDYVGEEVTIIANRIRGYPVEDGPVYLDVKRIK